MSDNSGAQEPGGGDGTEPVLPGEEVLDLAPPAPAATKAETAEQTPLPEPRSPGRGPQEGEVGPPGAAAACAGRAAPGSEPARVYACYTGDVEDVALAEPGVFAVDDTRGRRWYCHEVTAAGGALAAAVGAALPAQRAAHRQGFARAGTVIRLLRAERRHLAAALGAGPPGK